MSTTLGGMTPTGKRVVGPGADLVELNSDKGLKHTALVMHPEYRDHKSTNAVLGNVVTFYERPPHPAFAELVDFIPEEGAFIFATGTAWSVAELVRKLADQGRVGGIRAGLELMYLVAQALEEAQNTQRRHGLLSHGCLNPWRMLVRGNGDAEIIGYGLPQVDLICFLEDERRKLREDSFRYVPPERLERQPEDASSDLFTLSLVGFELMLGRPVYDGLVDDIRMLASRAEGGRRLHAVRDQLPEGVRELIGRAIKPDIDARWPSINEFIYAVHDLLNSPDAEGPHLIELVAKIRGAKASGAVMGGHTGALSKEQLQALRDEFDEAEAKPLPPPKGVRPDPNAQPEPVSDEQQRWARPVRRSDASMPPRPGRPGAPSSSGDASQRQIRRMGESGGSLTRSADPAPAAPAPERQIRRAPEDGPRRVTRGEGEEGPRRIPRGEADDGPRRVRDPARTAGAEALLNRLRSSGTPEKPPEAVPEPPPEPPRAPVVVEPPREAPRAQEPPPPPPPPPPPRVEPPPPRLEPPAPRVEPAAATPPPREETARPEITGRPTGTDQLAYFQVSVDGGPPQRTRIRTSEPLSDATNRLVQALAAPPTDLLGHATGWYRLEQDGKTWRGDETVAVLDPEKVVKVAFVPNRSVLASVAIEGLPEPIKFLAPIGTAVPVRSLVWHLQSWLKLPEASWMLFVEGQRLGAMQILEELAPSDGVEVVLRR